MTGSAMLTLGTNVLTYKRGCEPLTNAGVPALSESVLLCLLNAHSPTEALPCSLWNLPLVALRAVPDPKALGTGQHLTFPTQLWPRARRQLR